VEKSIRQQETQAHAPTAPPSHKARGASEAGGRRESRWEGGGLGNQAEGDANMTDVMT